MSDRPTHPMLIIKQEMPLLDRLAKAHEHTCPPRELTSVSHQVLCHTMAQLIATLRQHPALWAAIIPPDTTDAPAEPDPSHVQAFLAHLLEKHHVEMVRTIPVADATLAALYREWGRKLNAPR